MKEIRMTITKKVQIRGNCNKDNGYILLVYYNWLATANVKKKLAMNNNSS